MTIRRVLDPRTEDLIDAAAWTSAAALASSDRRGYARFLCALLTLIRDSVPLMEAALDIARAGGPDLADLPAYLERHVREERGHDACLVLDLRALQGLLGPAAASAPHPDIEHLLAWHWACLHMDDVWPLLGHMWALESRPPSRAGLDALRARLDLPRSATRALDLHAAEDPGHGDELAARIAALDPPARERVRLGATVTARGVLRCCRPWGEREAAPA